MERNCEGTEIRYGFSFYWRALTCLLLFFGVGICDARCLSDFCYSGAHTNSMMASFLSLKKCSLVLYRVDMCGICFVHHN